MKYAKLIIILLILLFAIFVWPTLYRFESMSYSGNTLLVKIHRITGHTEVLMIDKWVPIKD
jgi:membrane protein YdbS with pleckstrin-like domain